MRSEAPGKERSLVAARMLAVLAVAVILAVAAALSSRCIDAALDDGEPIQLYSSGWEVADMVLDLAGVAAYLPGVIIGLTALGLAQSEATRERASRMARPLLMAAAVVVLAGVGRAVCEEGSYRAEHPPLAPWITWYNARQVFGHLGRALFQGGLLVGLAYLSGWRSRPAESAAGPS